MKINIPFPLYSPNKSHLKIFRQAIAICLLMITLSFSFTQKVEANSIVKPQTYFLQTLQINDINISSSIISSIPSNIPQSQLVDPQAFKAGEKAVTGVSKGINSTLENVKEKLNLDEPLPQSTKKFLADPLAPQDENLPKKAVGSNV